MLNIKIKNMPNAIEAYGRVFLLNTDFRVWLTYPERLNAALDGDFGGYEGLFTDNVPTLTKETADGLNAFYRVESEIPRDKGGSNVIDYDLDADYIYSGFMQAYGIDLITADLHWHKFSALLSGLPEETTISKIISYRSYDGDDKEINKLKQSWALPLKLTSEEQEAMEEFNNLFG